MDFSADASFTTPFALCLDDVAAMPVFTPATPTGKQAMQSRTRQPVGRGGRYLDTGLQSVAHATTNDGVVVAVLDLVSAEDKSVVMAPKTRNGTGLEYYYTVRAVADDLTKLGTDSPVYASPNQLEVHETSGPIAAGFLPASSYWGYADVVGNTFRKVSSWVGSSVVEAPNRNVTMPGQHMYEVRFFSGGFGFGGTAAAYAFATTSFSAEHTAALYQNITMAVVELVGVIPGASEVLAEGDGGKILQAVVQKVIVDLQALIAAKGANVAGDDIYNLMVGVFKTAVDKAIEVASVEAQTGLGQKLLGWAISGGKKTFKAIVGLPGKVAKGGSLGNRAFRLSNPESVLEYYLVAVGYTPGECEPFMDAMAIRYGTYPSECRACANLACAQQCGGCDDACLEVEGDIQTYAVDACHICNAEGMSSTPCSNAVGTLVGASSYSPGAGQPQELATEVGSCIAMACTACNDWYAAEGDCTFPSQ